MLGLILGTIFVGVNLGNYICWQIWFPKLPIFETRSPLFEGAKREICSPVIRIVNSASLGLDPRVLVSNVSDLHQQVLHGNTRAIGKIKV